MIWHTAILTIISAEFLIWTDACRRAFVHAFTHWGRVTHICVGNLAIIGSDNGLSPGRRQAIIWTDAGILLIGPLETNFSEMWIGIQTFPLRKIHLKKLSAKWRLFCVGLNVLNFLQPSYVIANTGAWWNMRYPPETQLKLRFREVPFVNNTHLICPIILTFAQSTSLILSHWVWQWKGMYTYYYKYLDYSRRAAHDYAEKQNHTNRI